jgi:hypothetical protein
MCFSVEISDSDPGAGSDSELVAGTEPGILVVSKRLGEKGVRVFPGICPNVVFTMLITCIYLYRSCIVLTPKKVLRSVNIAKLLNFISIGSNVVFTMLLKCVSFCRCWVCVFKIYSQYCCGASVVRYVSMKHRRIRLIESNTKCRHLKKLTFA